MKIVLSYKEWSLVAPRIPKLRRYSLGVKIDGLFTELLELVSTAQFSGKNERVPIISHAISKNDVLKALLYVLLELDGITEEVFISLAPRLEEVGRMLYGWRTRIESEQKPPRT